MQRSSNTANTVAHAPMPMATPESSHTLRSTVKSLRMEGSDLICHLFCPMETADLRQGGDQPRRQFIQLVRMILGKRTQELPPVRSDLQFHVSPIIRILCPPDQPLLFTALAQLDHGVMAQSEPFCRIRDGRRHAVRNTGDLEQELVLLRMNPRFCCR